MIPILVYLFILLNIVSLLLITIFLPSYQSNLFLIAHQVMNTNLVLILCFFFGILKTKLETDNWVKRYFHILLPISIILIVWIKGVIVYMDVLTNKCSNDTIKSKIPYRFDLLLWNTSKTAISILIVYLIINFFSFFTVPFHELFSSDDEIITVIAIGVWLGCATWPSEASCYFNLYSSGCLPSQQITFGSLDYS